MKEVQYISDFRPNGRKLEFKVKWKMLPETQSEWLSFEKLACDKKLACDEEVLNSFKSDYLEQFLTCSDNDDYGKLFSENIDFRTTFARLSLLILPKDFKYNSAYKIKKMEFHELFEASLNIQTPPGRQIIHAENEVDLELFPSDFEWSNRYTSDLDLAVSEKYSGCKCAGTCFYSVCCYPNRYNKYGRLKDTKNRSYIYECFPKCSCDYNICTHRVVQKGSKCSLCIFKTIKKGWGVKTLEDIAKGTYISEYCGEIITREEFNNRAASKDYINKRMTYFFKMDDEYTIDATKIGNEARFFNHSCAPNMDVFYVKADTNLKYDRIAFFATEDIKKGQELTWDYCLKGETYMGKFCECGANDCRRKNKPI